MIEASTGGVGTKTVLFTDVVDSTVVRSALGDTAADELGSDTLGRRFFRGFLAYERQGEHRPDFELTDAIAEQLRLR